MTLIQEILKNSTYKLDLFTNEEIQAIENNITESKDKKGNKNYVTECLKRGSIIKVTPEEVVRQLFLNRIINLYKYSKDRIRVEFPIQFGSDSNSKRADIVLMDKERSDVVYIIFELKKPNSKEGKEQLKSYCNATGSPMGVWSNGGLDTEYYRRKEPNIFDKINNIPNANQRLEDVLNAKFTIWHLILENEKKTKTLKRIIEEFEDEVLANAGVDVFEEAFKLIFAKLFDEQKSSEDKRKINAWLGFDDKNTFENLPKKTIDTFRNLEFRNRGVETDTKESIADLFDEAKNKWGGIFPEGSTIELTPSHLQTCVSYLEDYKLFNSNLEVVDEAFEYLVNKDAKGDKGQYFTPRYIIDMGVKMMNPKPEEYIIDTAAGSCGFPVHTIFHVWEQQNPTRPNHFTIDEKTPEQQAYVREKVFAIDFDYKAVRVGKTLNLIAGDGETNVLHLNSLDYPRWEADFYENKTWRKQFGKGFENLEKLARKRNDYRYFNFDVLLANPPFAGDIRDSRVIRLYDVARRLEETTDPKSKKKLIKDKGWHEKISRDILFIERNLDMLKAGGRMAVVLPQGRFNNSSDKAIRQYLAERCRILAVVGLHGNSFKPHTGTKTSIIYLQKWDETLCPRVADYPIFFATQQKEGKNNSGDKLYWKNLQGQTTTEPTEALLDQYKHPIVYHDLFSTKLAPTPSGEGWGGATPNGIAEAFAEFARKEKLSFF